MSSNSFRKTSNSASLRANCSFRSSLSFDTSFTSSSNSEIRSTFFCRYFAAARLLRRRLSARAPSTGSSPEDARLRLPPAESEEPAGDVETRAGASLENVDSIVEYGDGREEEALLAGKGWKESGSC